MQRAGRIGVVGLVLGLLVSATPRTAAGQTAGTSRPRMNVLFIAVDDLRPDVGCYGVTGVKSPNIDRLAAEGFLFERAYCQQAVCSPSRTSLLTGRRPDTTRVYDLSTHFRRNLPDLVTLPEHFKKHGYHTQGLSKIYHGGLDDPQSWSVPHWTPNAPGYLTPEGQQAVAAARERLRAQPNRPRGDQVTEKDPKTGLPLFIQRRGQAKGLSWEAPECADNALADGMTADRAVKLLGELKDKPFFLAVGFLKPHLPFVAPRKYLDLYSPTDIRLAANPNPPEGMPPLAMTDFGELRSYADINKKGPIPDEKARDLIRAYRAATSYTDAQIGRVLDELQRLGLAERTVVVLWGDHGWHLGEHGHWCKHTNFEVATHAPLIVRAPNVGKPGTRIQALSEFVDIYPSLCELAGLPLPEGLEGTSFAPLLADPQRPWKPAAFSQYPRGKAMGYSMRTDRYRYTEWGEPGTEPAGRELYDHQTDPNENLNLAGKPEHAELVSKLSRALKAGWRQAKPDSNTK